MGPLALILLLSGLAIGSLLISDDDDSVAVDDSDPMDEMDDEELPNETEVPDIMPDTGASFVQTEDGVDIELGEDETGSLAVIYYLDTQDDPDDFIATDEARFYLVPEGVDWSDASW
ncbi:hypothetical protein [Falsiphaeobacter marinintestinus]|uniref:hypothetical protein n=1 Tax=Falsiphaeobacter marinintestinus TaxID=1492905 RepID=UPI0011B607F7|nr:hypothetical protein [Phaeobacter marinintestinus]